MATCPHCFESLSDGHRCSGKSAVRRTSQLAAVITAGIGIGAGVTMAGGGNAAFLVVVSALAAVVLHAAAKELSLI